jgi:flagellar assembly protein FliH
MMSLYKNSDNESAQLKSWTKYHMKFLEHDELVDKKDDYGFISLQAGELERGEFVPVEGYPDRQNKRKMGEGETSDAQENVSLIEQDAYEKGFVQGEKDGFELGERKANKVIENIEKLFDEMSTLKQEVLKQHEKEILDLTFAIAEKIVHRVTRFNEGGVKEAVFNALSLAIEKSKIVLNVNPEDYDYIEELRPDLCKKYKELKSIIVGSDPSITRGGCLLETPYGDIDARIETQLEKIYQCLTDSFNERENE